MQLYLGNLAPEVDEPLLYEFISQLAPVTSVRMPKHKLKQTPQGYGFAAFHSAQDAEYVQELLTSSPIKLHGRTVKVSSAAHTTTTGKASNTAHNASAVSRVYVGNLDPRFTDENSLTLPFKRFGKVVEVYIVHGSSDKCHAFISFLKQEAADTAVKELNGHYLLNRRVKVELEK